MFLVRDGPAPETPHPRHSFHEQQTGQIRGLLRHVGGGQVMAAKFSFSGGRELEQALKALGGQISGRLGNNATKAGARVIAADARLRVPVVTGRLKRSITVVGDDGLRRQGGSVRAAYVVARAKIAHIIEFGTVARRQRTTGRFTGSVPARPFLRPALDVAGQEAINRLSENLWNGIARESEKLAGVK